MDTIALTMKEQQRVAVIERVFRRELTMTEVAGRPLKSSSPASALARYLSGAPEDRKRLAVTLTD